MLVESVVPDGDPDPGFGGGDGIKTIAIDGGGFGEDVAIQPDGAILLATGGHWPLVRLEPDGDLDPTFSDDGIVEALGTTFHYAASLELRDDGTIFAGAPFRTQDFLTANFESDGDFDPAFGDDGIVTTDFADGTDTVADVAVDQNDHLIAGGKSARSGQTGTQRAFALARYKLGPSGPHFTVSHQTVRENG